MNSNIRTQTNRRETSDTYEGVLFRKDRYRVSVCRDGIQWLLQRRRHRISPGGAAWDNISYCTTRAALMRRYREYCGHTAPEFSSLPERISEFKSVLEFGVNNAA